MKPLLSVSILLALSVSVANAQIANLDERLVDVRFLEPPVTITNCHAGYDVPAWASDVDKANAPVGPVLPVYLQVQNTGPDTVWAYQILIVTYDAFGQYVDTIRATSVTALAPQRTDYGRWSLPVRLPDSAWTVVAYPSAVRFADGTIWRADAEEVAKYVPSAAPVQFHTWHIIPAPREVLPAKMKDLPPPAQ